MVTWTELALNDLKNIYNFINAGSTLYAKKVSTRFFEIAEELENFPRAGRMLPEENDPNLRELIMGSYRLIYEIDGKNIHILAIANSKQLLQSKRFRRN